MSVSLTRVFANAGIPVAMNALVPGSGMADMFIRNAGTGLARGIVNSPRGGGGGPQRVGGPGSPEGAMPTRKFGATRETAGEIKSGFIDWLKDPLQSKKEKKEQERDKALAVRLGITGAEYSLIHRPAMSLIKKRTGDVQTNLMILQFRVQQYMARHISAISATLGVQKTKIGHEQPDPNKSWFGHLLSSIHKDLQENPVFSTLESIVKHTINIGRILNPFTIASRTQGAVKGIGNFIQRLALGKEGYEMMKDPNKLYEKAGLKQTFQSKSINLMKINNEYQKLQLNMLYNVVDIGEQLLDVFGKQHTRQELDIDHDEYEGKLKTKKEAAIARKQRETMLEMTQTNATRRGGFFKYLGAISGGATNLVQAIHSSMSRTSMNSREQDILENVYLNTNPEVLMGLTKNLRSYIEGLGPNVDFRKDKDEARNFKMLLIEALNTNFGNDKEKRAYQQELRNSLSLSTTFANHRKIAAHVYNAGAATANIVEKFTGSSATRIWKNEHINKQRAYEARAYNEEGTRASAGAYQEETITQAMEDSIFRKLVRALGSFGAGIQQQHQLGGTAINVDRFLRRGATEDKIPGIMGYNETSGTPGQKLNITAATVITDIEDAAVKAIQRHRLLVSIANLRKETVDKLKSIDFRSNIYGIEDAAVDKLKKSEYSVRVHDFDQDAINTIKNNNLGGSINPSNTYNVNLVSVDQSITAGITTLASTLGTDIDKIINTTFVSNLRNLGEELVDINLKNAAADLIDNNLKRVVMVGVHELVRKYFRQMHRWNNDNNKDTAVPVNYADNKIPNLLTEIAENTEKAAGAGKWAKGGTFFGGSIGDYENQILTKPTFFNYNKLEKFAHGGAVGVAGEGSRAEGVLPLERNENGDLSVNIVGGFPTIDTIGAESSTRKAIAAVLVDMAGKPLPLTQSSSLSTDQTRRETTAPQPTQLIPAVNPEDDHVQTAAEREQQNQERQENREEHQRNERLEENEEEKKTLLQKIADFLDPNSKINKIREFLRKKREGGGFGFGFLGSLFDLVPGFIKTIGMTILGTQLMKLLPDKGKGIIKKVGGMIWDSITFIGGQIWELIKEHGPGLAKDTWEAIKEHPWLTGGAIMTMFPGTIGAIITKVAIPILKKNPLAVPIVLGVGGMIYNLVDTISKGEKKDGEFDVPTFLKEFLIGSGSGTGRLLGKIGTWGTIGATIGAAFGGVGALPGFILGSAVGYIIGDTKSTNDKGEFDMTVFLKNLLLGNEKQGGTNNALKQAGKLAMIGAMAGIPFGPIGMITGGLLGGAVGGIAGFIGSDKFDAYWSKTDSGKEIAAKFGFKHGSMAYDMAMSPTANKLPYVGPFIWGWLGYLIDLGDTVLKNAKRAIARLNPWKDDPEVEEYKKKLREGRTEEAKFTDELVYDGSTVRNYERSMKVTKEEAKYINEGKDNEEKKKRAHEVEAKHQRMREYADEAKFKYDVEGYVEAKMRWEEEDAKLLKKYPHTVEIGYSGRKVSLTDQEHDTYLTRLFGKTKGTPNPVKDDKSELEAINYLNEMKKLRDEEEKSRKKKRDDEIGRLEIGSSPEELGGPPPSGSSAAAAIEAQEYNRSPSDESGGGKDDDLPDVGSLPIVQMAEEYTKYANEHKGEKLERFTPNWKPPTENKPKSPSSAPAAMKANDEQGGDDGPPDVSSLPIVQMAEEYSRLAKENPGKELGRFTPNWKPPTENKPKSVSSTPAVMKAKKKSEDDAPPDVSSLPIVQMAEEYSRLAKENPGKDLGRFTPDWKPPKENEPTKSMGSIPATKSIGNAPVYKSIGNVERGEAGDAPQTKTPKVPTPQKDAPKPQPKAPEATKKNQNPIDPSSTKVVPKLEEAARKQAEEQNKKPAETAPPPQQPAAEPAQPAAEPQPQDFNNEKVEGPDKLNWIERLIANTVKGVFRFGGFISDLLNPNKKGSGDGFNPAYDGSGIALGRFGFISMKYESAGDVADITNDTANSHSYGLYQFNSGENDGGGTMHEFVSFLEKRHPDLYKPLAGKKVGSADFNKAYKEVANAHKDSMGNAQEEFLKEHYYKRGLDDLKRAPDGSSMVNRFGSNRAFQEMLVSTAVQHGPGNVSNIFGDAWSRVPQEKKTGDDKEALAALATEVYRERGNEKYFRKHLRNKSSAERERFLKSIRKNRYAKEAGDILSLIHGRDPGRMEKGGNVWVPSDVYPGAPMVTKQQLEEWRISPSEQLTWPSPYNIVTSPFGPRRGGTSAYGGSVSPWHRGTDIRARDLGNSSKDIPIFAAMGGKVVGTDPNFGQIQIQHDNGWKTRYLHLRKFNVEPGQKVTSGQPIGLAGGIGKNGKHQYTPHLHFEMHKNNKFINPEGVFYSYVKHGGKSVFTGAPENYAGVRKERQIPSRIESGGDENEHSSRIRSSMSSFLRNSPPKAPSAPSGGIISPPKPSTAKFEVGDDGSRSSKIRASMTEFLNEKKPNSSGKNIGESIVNELKGVKVLLAAMIKVSNRPVVAVAPPASSMNDDPKRRSIDDDGTSDFASENIFSQIGGILPDLTIATTGLGTSIA